MDLNKTQRQLLASFQQDLSYTPVLFGEDGRLQVCKWPVGWRNHSHWASVSSSEKLEEM